MVAKIVARQAELGIDIVTDGEVGREGYYMHFLRNGLEGVDLCDLSDKVMRDGAFITQVPSVVGRVVPPPSPWCYKEFLRARASCPQGTQLKYTLPGPMTIMDGTYNRHYQVIRHAKLYLHLVSILILRTRGSLSRISSECCKER